MHRLVERRNAVFICTEGDVHKSCRELCKTFPIRQYVSDSSIPVDKQGLLNRALDFLHSWGSKGRVNPSKKQFSWVYHEKENEISDAHDVDGEDDNVDEDEDYEQNERGDVEEEENGDAPHANITGGTMSYILPCKHEHKVSNRLCLYNHLHLARGRKTQSQSMDFDTFDAVQLKGMSAHNTRLRFVFVYAIRRISRPRRDRRRAKEEDYHIMYVDTIACFSHNLIMNCLYQI